MADNETPDEKPANKAHLHIDDLRENADEGGMSLERYEEISDAIAEGRHGAYTSEERDEFDDHARRVKELLRPLGKRLPNVFRDALPNLQASAQQEANRITDSSRKPTEGPRLSELTPKSFPQHWQSRQAKLPVISDEVFADIASARREKNAQEKAVADAIQKMAGITAQEATESKKRYDDSIAETNRRHKASMWVGWLSAGAALLAAAVAAFSLYVTTQSDSTPPAPAPSHSQAQETPDPVG